VNAGFVDVSLDHGQNLSMPVTGVHKPRNPVNDSSGVCSSGDLLLGKGRHDTLNLTYRKKARLR
jgi:hypothetical protein